MCYSIQLWANDKINDDLWQDFKGYFFRDSNVMYICYIMYNQTFHGVVDVMFDMFCIVILAAIFG